MVKKCTLESIFLCEDRPKFPDIQQAVWRSGYARLGEYRLDNEKIYIFDKTTWHVTVLMILTFVKSW